MVELVTVLARQMPDQAIAAVLNRAGKKTGRGNGWTRSRVCLLRNHRGITPYHEGERAERGEVTLDEAAAALDVSAATVRRMINERLLPARQLCKGAPWVIRTDDSQVLMSGALRINAALGGRRLTIRIKMRWLSNSIARWAV